MVFGKGEQKPIDEVVMHPNFPYRMGRLIGAAELAAFWMSIQEDEETRRMGARLGNVASWFFKDETWKDPAETFVLPPTVKPEAKVAKGS